MVKGAVPGSRGRDIVVRPAAKTPKSAAKGA
jgi:ribosomal protein L3